MKSTDKTIAKNTIFLYFRMLLTMFVTLYTSRVVLDVLGITDYGLYQTVGGIVALLSFVNGAISTGSSRFLTFELGKCDFLKLKRTFSTTLTSHIFIAIVVFIFAESVGLWFVSNKIVVSDNRIFAAQWVYQFSIVTAIINIIQVPYTASIIAHERMNVYAYLSIVEVTLKLVIVYLLQVADFDKLILYSFFICIIQIIICLFYVYYCVVRFKEVNFKLGLDRDIFKAIFSFSGWSLFSNSSIALNEQGTTIITNLFFGPSVVTARAISIQVNMAANQFVNNFRTAVNPQIVKKLAINDVVGSKSLLLSSVKYSFYLMFLLGLPIILLADPILHLWLVEVPEYTVLFLQLIIVQSLFSVFDTSFYTALYAKGRLKENALISPIIGFIRFPIVYVLFRMGYSPLVLSYAGILTYAILGLIVKPILICKVAEYRYKEIFDVFISCIKVCLFSIPIPLLANYYLDELFYDFILIAVISVISVLFSVFYIGLDAKSREIILTIIKNKFK